MTIVVETMFLWHRLKSREFPVHVEAKLVQRFLEELRVLLHGVEGVFGTFEGNGPVIWKSWTSFFEGQWKLNHMVRANSYFPYDLVEEVSLIVGVTRQLIFSGTLDGKGSLLIILKALLGKWQRINVGWALGLSFKDLRI